MDRIGRKTTAGIPPPKRSRRRTNANGDCPRHAGIKKPITLFGRMDAGNLSPIFRSRFRRVSLLCVHTASIVAFASHPHTRSKPFFRCLAMALLARRIAQCRTCRKACRMRRGDCVETLRLAKPDTATHCKYLVNTQAGFKSRSCDRATATELCATIQPGKQTEKVPSSQATPERSTVPCARHCRRHRRTAIE